MSGACAGGPDPGGLPAFLFVCCVQILDLAVLLHPLTF
ncbi:putative membrane protein [Bordetella holmesii 30539]|uniref:Uncharacterized protein n=2 Tax=Bordetella holmesii TaxID=35814 RepID=A0A158M2F4_9BORD|nr:putative membrane protein [Bordetella holmesii ATCC 51541]AIT25000.1 putative membrane protein [Bordetella holmesii 44057]EWM48613.1 putative membrane protein [Bordetella holmesii 41130]EWM49685.1 putative membrane protein [Bordetella holmesii 35009]EXF89040.1 putative membrane protein [Bordetella holmesii 30539]EXX94856.1 putative membrane protein [Bordetella holmesii 1058]KAK69404.1 hypothetical protein L573_2213 [Bordetella holmesii H620]KAK77854.1 hypothetical protein L503_2004 [Borde